MKPVSFVVISLFLLSHTEVFGHPAPEAGEVIEFKCQTKSKFYDVAFNGALLVAHFNENPDGETIDIIGRGIGTNALNRSDRTDCRGWYLVSEWRNSEYIYVRRNRDFNFLELTLKAGELQLSCLRGGIKKFANPAAYLEYVRTLHVEKTAPYHRVEGGQKYTLTGATTVTHASCIQLHPDLTVAGYN